MTCPSNNDFPASFCHIETNLPVVQHNRCKFLTQSRIIGAKSELPGGTVGVCSVHRRCCKLPNNLPITHLRFTPRSLQVCLLANFNK